MKTEIRFAKASDKKDFVELALNRDKAINEPPRKDYWSKKFRSLPKSNRLLLGCINSKPVGFLYFTFEFIDYPAIYVELVFVASAVRKQGIARQMFVRVEQIAAENSYNKVFSSTNPSNTTSLAMHKNLGFRRCGFIDGIESPHSREILLSKNVKNRTN